MGDVMLGELLENFRRGLKSTIEKRGIDPFEHVKPLLKDADALDRVRLGDGAWEVDSTTLRHGCTVEMVDFAVELLEALP